MSRSSWPWLALGGWLIGGCTAQPAVPDQPTWADVQPILRGNCAGCHGSTATQTGLGYRLDLYDMSADVCGAAADAIPVGPPLAAASAASIATDITPPAGGGRERMPPLPAATLEGWERETLLRWTKQPIKGAPPPGNRPATIQVFGLPSTATSQLSFTALIADPDGDEAVGVIKVADAEAKMNRSGSFAVSVDLTTAAAGRYPVTGIVCDGWVSSSFDLGWVDVKR